MRKILLFSFFLSIIKAEAQPGALDPTFGVNGYVPVSIKSGLKFQHDGKLVRVTAEDGSIIIYRLNANGTPDKSFGNGGKSTSLVNFFNVQPVSFAIGNNGKIIVLANTILQEGSSTLPGFALLRYNSNGLPDPTFGVNGIVKTLFNSNGQVFNMPDKVTIQNSGDIVVTHTALQPGGSDLLIRRFNTTGTQIDACASTAFPANYPCNAHTSIVIPGGGNAYRTLFFAGHNERLLVFQYNNDLTNIITVTDQKDGKIIAATTDNKLYRFNTDGTLDAAFGIGGIVTMGWSVNKILIQNNGNIITAGNLNGNLALARYNNDGSLDQTFGIAGMVNGDSNGGGIYDMIITGDRLYCYGSNKGNPVIAAYVLEQINNPDKEQSITLEAPFKPDKTGDIIDLSVRVISNPTHTCFTLLTRSNIHQPLSVKIVDYLGRNLFTKNGITPNGTLQIGSNLGRGVYFAEVRQGNKTVKVKLIKLSN